MEGVAPGRIVHYVSYGTPGGEYASCCRVALITEVAAGGVLAGLCVINPTGIFFRSLADGGSHYYGEADEDGAFPGGTWHWPERA